MPSSLKTRAEYEACWSEAIKKETKSIATKYAEELEARAAGLVANVFSDMPLTELARDTKRRPELAQLMKAWFDPDPAGVAKEYEDDRAKLMKSFPEKYGKGCRVACMMACIKKCPPEIHLATCEETNCAPQCRQKCIEMGME